MPGTIQIVPRAELFAIVVAAENVDSNEEFTISSDSEVNVKLYHRGTGATTSAANYDLWCWLRKAEANRAAPLLIRWTKGHGTEEHLREGLISH